jgi:cytoskeleton protein RodZ
LTEAASEAGGERGVGAELAAARQERGVGLQEVAQQLKFGVRQLEALEADRFDELPGGTFARGMVRNYARLLKIDPEPLLARITDRFNAPDTNQLAARFSQPVPFSDAGRRSTFVYLALSLGVLVVVAGVAYQWQHERSSTGRQMAFVKPKAATSIPNPAPKPAPHPAPALVEQEKPAEVVKAPEPKKAPEAPKAPEARKPVEAKKLAEAKTPVEERKPASPVQTVAAPPPGGTHRIVMRVETDEAWLEVTDASGRQLVSSLNRAGAERVVQGRGPFTFVIGNASHVRIEHNGREFDLKPYTRVEVARFTIP